VETVETVVETTVAEEETTQIVETQTADKEEKTTQGESNGKKCYKNY
jgi:hypothetical protein